MEFFVHAGYAHPDDFRRIARTAEDVGLDGLLIPDHVFLPTSLSSPYPYTSDGRLPMPLDTNWPDPWVLIGALGETTTRLRFLTNVFVLALRNPLFVARSAGTAAVLTGGRIIMGVGVGWMRDEYQALGGRFAHRGKITDRSIDILRRVWRDGGLPDYHDEFFDFPELVMLPKPDRPVPIVIGGDSDAAFDRAARLGDGFVSTPHRVSDHLSLVEDLRQRVEAAGRSPADFQYWAGLPRGELEHWTQLAEVGVTGITVRLWPAEEQELSVKQAALEAFARKHVGLA